MGLAPRRKTTWSRKRRAGVVKRPPATSEGTRRHAELLVLRKVIYCEFFDRLNNNLKNPLDKWLFLNLWRNSFWFLNLALKPEISIIFMCYELHIKLAVFRRKSVPLPPGCHAIWSPRSTACKGKCCLFWANWSWGRRKPLPRSGCPPGWGAPRLLVNPNTFSLYTSSDFLNILWLKYNNCVPFKI